MGWLPAPTRRPPPLPSTLSLLLGFLFFAAVVLPRVAAEPKPQEEYYAGYGEYCLPLYAIARTHTLGHTSHHPTRPLFTQPHVLFTLPYATHAPFPP